MQFRMRIPTKHEYDRMMAAADGDDSITHWSSVAVWAVGGPSDSYTKALRGFTGPFDTTTLHRSCHYNVGFRPAFDCTTPKELPKDLKRGDIIVIGSLYMNGKPVRIQQQFEDKRVAHYLKDAKLEIRDELDLPNSSVWAIYIGDGVFVCDRPVLRDISYDDIEFALK